MKLGASDLYHAIDAKKMFKRKIGCQVN